MDTRCWFEDSISAAKRRLTDAQENIFQHCQQLQAEVEKLREQVGKLKEKNPTDRLEESFSEKAEEKRQAQAKGKRRNRKASKRRGRLSTAEKIARATATRQGSLHRAFGQDRRDCSFLELQVLEGHVRREEEEVGIQPDGIGILAVPLLRGQQGW